jgi:OOP family OmpA-OmpF porin
MKKNLLLLASGTAAALLITGCASGPKHEAPPPAPAPVKSYTIKGVNFEFDSAKLTPAAKGILDEAASGIKAASGHTFNVVGHTDSVGSDAFNMGLGERRAQSVTDALVSRGVPASQLRASSMGERQPLATNATAEGRAENRRVEITPVK